MSAIPLMNGAKAAPAAASTGKPMGAMDHNDFLRLMTTQLTTQDPFNPVDNSQMVAQMAQFSQVAGIAEMNKSLAGIAATLNAGRLSDAANWIGHSMLVKSDVATPLRDGTYAGEIDLPADAGQVTLSFLDENGRILHSEQLGAQGAGQVGFAWNGRDAEGEPVAGGPLRVVVNATGAKGAVQPSVATWTSIGGIQSPAHGGLARLVTGLGLLSPEAALRLA
jgi:flagellar basal-body rod modification protein FlgD